MKEVREVKVKCELCGNIFDLNTYDNRYGKCECGNSNVEAHLSWISWGVPKELKGNGVLYSEYSSSKCYYLNQPKLTDEELKMLNYILNSKSTMTNYMFQDNTSNISIDYGSTKSDKFIKVIHYRECILKFKSYNYTGINFRVDFTEDYNQKLISFYRLCRMADKNHMQLDDYVEMIARKNIEILPYCYEEDVIIKDLNICL